MKKNMKHLFLITTLLVLLVGLTAISAADVSDNSTVTDTHVQTPSADSIENVDAVQTDHKEVQTTKSSADKKTKEIKKETKQENRTVTDYDSLKTTWNEIESNGTTDTEYTINVKNGEYKFEEQLVLKNTKATHLNVIGEDADKTIFNGQNKTRLFLLNKVKLNVTFKNITFINAYENNSRKLGTAIESYSNLNVDNCHFINNYNNGSYSGGTIFSNTNSNITNCSFTNNYALSGGAIYFNRGNSLIGNCSFINNSANNGGAVYSPGYAIIGIENSTFIGNHGNDAGAFSTNWIYSYGSYINNCFFMNNTGSTFSTINLKGQNGITFSINNSYFEGQAFPVGMYPTTGSIKTTVENNIIILVNNKAQGTHFTQNDKTLLIKAVYYGKYINTDVKSIANDYAVPLKINSEYVNDTVLSPSNNYTAIIDLTKLPSDFENFTISADGMDVAAVSYKKTDVTFKPLTAVTGNTITLNALFTENGVPIEKGKVAFKINGKTIGHSDVQFGHATLTYKLPLHSAKKYTLNVVYGGNKDYNEARVNTTLTLTKINTESIIQTANATTGNKMQINVKTLDASNNTVNGGKIAVKVNRKTVKVLNNTGNITVEFNVPKSWSNRNITVQTAFSGTGVYSGCRNETSLTVKETKTAKKTVLKQDTVQNSYYVSADNGSDSNQGTQTSPFKTIAHAISVVNSTKSSANIYLTGRFTGVGNTNLTVPGDLNINFIGIGNASIDGELNYTYKYTYDTGEYYWGSSKVWEPYWNGTGNWAMNITRGNGHITISNLTITRCWSAGGSSISAYPTATIDNYGNLEVNNVSFIYNCAGVGAGIRNNANATVTVTNSLFDANRKSSSTGNDGAGIYNNGTATIINSTFQNNYARWGTVTNDKVLTIINSTIRDNIAYDGGSTYKTGSGITINTGYTDFYNQGNVNSTIKTVIDGCTFINNDQLDVYADKGDLNLTNNVFTKSTGVLVPSASSNYTVKYNIINNTITSPIGSSIQISLSTSDKVIFGLALRGSYNYTVENNTILKVTGTDSKAIELSSNYARIFNNNVGKQILIDGSYNNITNNNITTTDTYAINIKGSRNNITDNRLESSLFKGNTAVNNTDNTNIIQNNTPEPTDIKISDSTYSNYFDKNGNLLPGFNKINVIEINETLSNKTININQTVTFKAKNTRIMLYNVTITTTGNGKINVNGLKITNNNNREAFIINTNNNKIEKTDIQTNAEYTIILNGLNNTITNNQLVADILVGNESVQTEQNNTISNNKPTYKNYILTNDTYGQYFDENGTLKNLDKSRDVHFLVNGTISDKNFKLNGSRIITMLNYANAVLYNATITIPYSSGLNMSHITIINSNNSPALIFNSSMSRASTITYNTIITNTDAIKVYNSNQITINYNNITANSTENITAITINEAKATKFQIQGNHIETIGPATQITDGRVGTNSIELINTTGITISNNIITTRYNTITGQNDTIYSINQINTRHQSNSNTITNNNIYTYGNTNAHGVNIINQTINLAGNTITTNATNTIGSYILNSTKDIKGNRFIQTSPTANALTVILSNGINITSNNFNLNGNNTTAIKLIQSNITSITGNNLNINGQNQAPIELINTTKTEITQNLIFTTTNYTIIIHENSTENSVTNNTLYAKTLISDTSILNQNVYNRIMNNKPDMITKYYLNDETYSQFFDSNGTLRNEIPEGLTILVTGNIHNKTLNITKAINLITDQTNYINTTIILTGNNINITGQPEITGENIKLIINGNNNTIESSIFETDNNENINITPITITGNSNKINISNVNIQGNENINSTIINITGNNNDINIGNLKVLDLNNVTGVLFDKASNNNLNIKSMNLSTTKIENTIILRNSNYNTININGLMNAFKYTEEEFTAIQLNNSSYNYITGQNIYGNKILILNNTSNNNTIENLQVSSLWLYNIHVKGIELKTPIIIEESNNNKIFNCSLTATSSLNDYAINITESVGNIIEYNNLKTVTLTGNNAVIQENQNGTINNIVQYNGEPGQKNIVFNLESPNTIKMGDTLTITINMTYNNGSFRRPAYIPMTNGTLTVEINGETYEYNVTEGINLNSTIITKNYKITKYNNGQTIIKATYKDPTLTYKYITITKTISVLKHDTILNLGNFTNNGITSILTAIVTDVDGKIIDNGTVVFKANDEVIGTVDITNKVAVLPVSIANYKAGVYNLTAEFNGNDYYCPSDANGTLSISEYTVNPSITPVTAKAGETVTLTSIIRDVNGNLVDNGIAVFKLNNKTLKDEFGETIYADVHNGIASINYTIPDNYSAKDYNLTVVTSGDTYKRAENTTKLTITKHNAQILLEPLHVTRSNNTNIKIEIVDENGNPITGSTKVAVKLNGKTQLHTRAVDGILDFNMDLTNYKHDSYDFSVVIAGNSIYNNARASNIIFLE